MTLVIDSSVVIAALVESGPVGQWAENQLLSDHLAAPHIMQVEVANVLRRAERVGGISTDVASLAHHDLIDLPVDLYPYEPFSSRIWQLRSTVTAYDAWYVALAEVTGAALATLDRRLTSAPGPTCSFVTP